MTDTVLVAVEQQAFVVEVAQPTLLTTEGLTALQVLELLGTPVTQLLTLVDESVTLLTATEQGPAGASALLSYPGAVALSGHIAITLDALGQALPADCSVAAHAAGVLGVTLGASSTGAPAVVVLTGGLSHLGWAFTPGLPVFLGLAGALTQARPAQAIFSKVLGMAVTPTRVNLDFQPSIFL